VPSKKKLNGQHSKGVITAAGFLTIKRHSIVCSRCHVPSDFPVDSILGIENGYSLQARRLIVLAGGSWSFDSAADHLDEFCGIRLSDNTVRTLCQTEASKIADWQKTPEACKPFQQTVGDVEFTTDGTCVNTQEGWREMKVAIFAKRKRGEPCLPEDWAQRELPKPECSVMFAAIEPIETFKLSWPDWCKRLRIHNFREMTVVSDGGIWILNATAEMFYQPRQNLDVYHALEYVNDCGKVWYGAETPQYKVWNREMTLEVLSDNGARRFMERLGRMRLSVSISEETASDLDKKRDGERLKIVDTVLGYFEKQAGRMNYAERLSAGRSIGSGQVEGACKNLIGKRLKQTGARWNVRRVNRMATICAIMYSDQWDDYWRQAK
jgi:hypothetical protein